MRKWWVWPLLYSLVFPLTLTAAESARDAIASAPVSSELRAILTADYEIEIVVQPHPGDAWTRLALRVTGDASRWEEIAQLNGADDTLIAGRAVRVPFAAARPELRRKIIESLFPRDRSTPAGWKHTVLGGRGIEGESLWKIAEWFTGEGANYSAIRKANPNQGLSTRPGDVILVPKRLLIAAFGGESEGENAQKTAEVRKQENHQAERSSTDEDVPEAAAAALGQPALTYERKASEPYAVYRLQKGEALYSSVAIRFSGRVYSPDVGDVLEQIVKFNQIEDVSRLPVGYPVRIPLDLLLPEYLPADDPERVAAERSKRASARVAKRTRAVNLSGVHVILDAGHGGRDVGTIHDDVWESVYMYDVTLRLRKLLESKSGARVTMTTRSKQAGLDPSRRDVISQYQDHYVQTTPAYPLEDAIVGVNLRWYLANSIFRKALKSGVPREKVVFLSLHADSLHPALRGGMAYIPGQRFVQGSYVKKDAVYLARAEVRERPLVSHSESEALLAAGLSRDLAESIIESFRRAGLAVHPFNPVRDNVVRERREWVPAIIRHNIVPTRALLEVCNLGNPRDRELIKTRAYRQKVAEAIYRGIVAYYADAPRPDARQAAR
ncbi:MAG TPA: N-acetylmuramoyl-L-alanine amidase [Thermoanaerobaculia bacterium]|nr:N-acetylmuramoyl-L-alanine amidase [Thermoanaerobaculia bacterium]